MDVVLMLTLKINTVKMNKTKLLEIAHALNLGSIDDEKARTLLLGLLGVSKSFYCQHKLVLDCKEQCFKCHKLAGNNPYK
jgi:hypothetical protein|tara:strand:+ start:1491 stop:1730 length:240 start_codon:yes stop_codon:yes gene_type:complete